MFFHGAQEATVLESISDSWEKAVVRVSCFSGKHGETPKVESSLCGFARSRLTRRNPCVKPGLTRLVSTSGGEQCNRRLRQREQM